MKKIIILTLVAMNLIGCEEIEQQLQEVTEQLPSVVEKCGDGFITEYLKDPVLVLSDDLNGIVQLDSEGNYFIMDIDFVEDDSVSIDGFVASHYAVSDAEGSDKELNAATKGVLYGDDHVFKSPCTGETHNNF